MRLRLFEFPALLVVAFMAVVAPARADCDVPESGVTEDAVPVDFAGVRKSLAESGVAIGGYYAAETLYSSRLSDDPGGSRNARRISADH